VDGGLVVVLKFSKGKEVGPIILSLVNEEPEVLFQLLDHSVSLTISLRVVGSGSSNLIPSSR